MKKKENFSGTTKSTGITVTSANINIIFDILRKKFKKKK